MSLKKALVFPITAAILAGSAAAVPASAESAKTTVQIKSVAFAKVSSTKIKLGWSDAKDAAIKTYHLQRYDENAGKWKTITSIGSDGTPGNGKYVFTDVLSSSAPQQYRYRVNVTVSDAGRYTAANGKTQYASNIKVCLDPGHYQQENGGTYGYTEAEAVLSIAETLKTCLKIQGIDVYMTRTDEDITLGGKYNTDDGTQLAARGHAAKSKKCDVFISLHTNANGANANNCDTLHQPTTLNKTVVFVNKTAYNQSAKTVINMANRMGYNVTEKNKELGIPTTSWLSLSNMGGKPASYSDDDLFNSYNDALRKKGKTIFRTLDNGQDYYAVLRAAASDNVPGILIEHSFHTVPAFCQAFTSDPNVAKQYALADARAIGAAYKFKVLKSI